MLPAPNFSHACTCKGTPQVNICDFLVEFDTFDDTEPVMDIGWIRSSGFTLCNLILGFSIMHLCYKTLNFFGKL